MGNSFEARNEIESIIKKSGINRIGLFEVNKHSYEYILNQIISKFINPNTKFDFNLHRGFLPYNPKLRCIGINCKNSIHWWQWFRLLSELTKNCTEAVHVIFVGNDYSWAYEGFIPELMEILYEGSPIGEGDCYITSKKYEWLIGYSDDGDCVTCCVY